MKRTLETVVGGFIGLVAMGAIIFGFGILGVFLGVGAEVTAGICLVFAVLVAVTTAVVTRARHRNILGRRIIQGCCPSCGYDLRSSPGRCPECGAEQTNETRRRWLRQLEP